MAPAGKRFERDDPAGPDVDDRLEMDVDRAVGDRDAQFELDQPAHLDLRVHLSFKGAPAAAPVRLRRIERDIRFGQKYVRRRPVVRRRGGPDAGADDNLAAVDDDRSADLFDDAPGERGSAGLPPAMAVEDDELIAAPSGDQVARADDPASLRAISAKSLSPVAWPRLSLTCLKLSRSRNITVSSAVGRSGPKREGECLLEAPGGSEGP